MSVMSAKQASSQPKGIILAAGRHTIADDSVPIVLQALDKKRVIDYVVDRALEIVAPEDLIVVVPDAESRVRTHLTQSTPACAYQFVIQNPQLGTGHAVQQVHPLLQNYDGDLLILYGDTPLFRPASIRGLLNRHRLKGAHLTLLTAVVQHVLPYGRIIRDAGGHIIDIIEDVEASPDIREIQELNAGAYLVRAPEIFTVLETLAQQGERVRLTDCVHRMLRSGMRVESYCIYDEDEEYLDTEISLDDVDFKMKVVGNKIVIDTFKLWMDFSTVKVDGVDVSDVDEEVRGKYGFILEQPEDALEDEKISVEFPEEQIEATVSVLK